MFLPTSDEIHSWPNHTKEKPLKILASACLSGEKCGVDGSSYGEFPIILKLLGRPNVRAITFCPEHFSFGTPRHMPDIHGGNGFDVLDGKARVLTDKGEDWTAGMVTAAQKMLKIALENQVDIAVLTDISAACGSQVISDGCRFNENRKYQKGPGVCAALLIRNGIKVISHRDYRTLELLFKKLDPTHQVNDKAIDHHESEFYRNYFAEQ